MYVYLLNSLTSNRTYVGMSNDPWHRLRQHNGYLKGGAKYTRSGRPWIIQVIISGFPSRSAALSFEKRWHIVRKPKYRIRNFEKQLEWVINRLAINNKHDSCFDLNCIIGPRKQETPRKLFKDHPDPSYQTNNSGVNFYWIYLPTLE